MALQDPSAPDPMDPVVADEYYDYRNPGVPHLDDQGVQRIGNNGVVEERAGAVPPAYQDPGFVREDTNVAAPMPQPENPGSVSWQLKQGEKVSNSSRGITDAGIAKTKQLTGFAGVDQRTESMMAPQKDLTDETGRKLTDARGRQAGALDEYAQSEFDHHAKLKALHERVDDFNTTFQQVERRMADEAKVEREQYIGAYREQLAGVKQLMAQDANPLHHVTKGGMLGLGAAAFAQGFLGAQGIKIDVTGQIDTWVDRELKQHQQKIVNARSSAEDQITLYKLARETSKDDSEAREKLRGFFIEGFKNKVAIEAERFGSEGARTRAKEKIAQLDAELAITLDRLGNNYFEKRLQTRSAIVSEVAQQGQLAIQGASLALQREKEAREIRKENAAALTEMKGRVLYDTSTKMAPRIDKDGKPVLDPSGKPVMEDKGGGGAARWVIRDGIKLDDKRVLEYSDKQANVNHLQGLLDELGKMTSEYGNLKITDKLAASRFASTNQRKMMALQSEILSNYAQEVSGKAVTDNEIKRLQTLVPEALFGTDANLGSIYSQTYTHWTGQLDKKRQQIADVIPETMNVTDQKTGKTQAVADPRRSWKIDNKTHFNELGYAENSINAKQGDAKGVETKPGIAVQAMSRPDAGHVAKDELYTELNVTKDEMEGVQAKYLQAHNPGKRVVSKDMATKKYGEEARGIAKWVTGHDALGQTSGDEVVFGDPAGWAVSVYALSKEAKHDPQSKAQLFRIANRGLGDAEYDDGARSLARWLIEGSGEKWERRGK